MFPDWLASITQDPVVSSVTVFPDTVQTFVVVEEKLTVSPELAVALTVMGEALSGWFDKAPKVMVWLALVTMKLRFTGVAAR